MSDVFDISALHALTMGTYRTASDTKQLITALTDGGGVNTLGTLVTVSELMRAIQAILKLPNAPRPCQWFKLIVGTGTGGYVLPLIACPDPH